MVPILLLVTLVAGAFSVVVYVLSGWLLAGWYDRSLVAGPDLLARGFQPEFGWNVATLMLAVGVGLLLWSVAGGRWARRERFLRGSRGRPAPLHESGPAEVRWLDRPDGSRIAVEVVGPDDAPTLLLTNGWGPDRTEWYDLRGRLSGRYRLVLWDLPGLNDSRGPADRNYTVERMARDLDAVIEAFVGPQPLVLVGHSIGGMILLTYCRLFPERLDTRVAGLALVFTTYTNPLRTMHGATIMTRLERPLLRPMLRLTIALSPLVWLTSLLNFVNGSAHAISRWFGFAGAVAPSTVDKVARYHVKVTPSIMARGALGMLDFEETATLLTVSVPTLIVAGDRDPVTLPRASERMRSEIPGSDLVVLQRAKHMGLLEHPERFAGLIAGFVDRVAAQEASQQAPALG